MLFMLLCIKHKHTHTHTLLCAFLYIVVMNGYIPYITLKGEALCTFEKLMQSKITDKIKELHVAKINK